MERKVLVPGIEPLLAIVFEFTGGVLDGRSVGRASSGVGPDHEPALQYWVDSYFGSVGRHFHAVPLSESTRDDFYQVIRRTVAAKSVVLQAQYRPDPRD